MLGFVAAFVYGAQAPKDEAEAAAGKPETVAKAEPKADPKATGTKPSEEKANHSLPASDKSAADKAVADKAAAEKAAQEKAAAEKAAAEKAAADKAAAEAAAQRKAAIDLAKARCMATMAKLDIVAIPREPIEDGECGTLAPVELVAVGKAPQVALSPPVIVNCDMAAAIHDWVKQDVQPLAKKHLTMPVSRIETMSSYSCRNAFGRKNGKLSEHGKANAVDIRGFVTVKGDTAYVLEHWGPTVGELRAIAAKAEEERKAREIAEAKAKADAEARLKAVAAGKGGPAAQGGGAEGANPISAAGSLIERLPKPSISINGGAIGGGSPPSDLGIAPSRLGGPKPQDSEKPDAWKPEAAKQPAAKAEPGRAEGKAAKSPAAVGHPVARAAPPAAQLHPAGTGADKLDNRADFLRAVHEASCKRFMTALGPEADKAHRNHFHIDLAERRTGKQICD